MIFKPCNTCYGNPIFPEQGLKVQSIAAGGQPWAGLSLIYNSEKIQYEPGASPFPRSNPATFGPQWTASFDKGLYFSTVGNARLVNVSRGGGAWTTFQQGAAGLAPASGMLNDRLSSTTQGYLYRDADAMRLEEYNDRGQLLKITALDGRSLSIARTGIGTVTVEAQDEGLPLSLTDHFGRRWLFEYTLVGAEPASRVAAIVDPGQGRVTIGYGANGQVGRLEWADGTAQQMMYEHADLSWALTGYLDERGARAATYGYDSLGRAVSTQRALGLDSYLVTWETPPEMKVAERYDPDAGVVWRDHELKPPVRTMVRLPNGEVQALESTASFGLPKWTLKSQAAGAGSAAVTSSRSFDANLNVTRLDDFNGNRSCMNYDMSRNLETSRVEGLTAAVDCASVAGTLPAGTRKVSTQWHPDWPLAVKTAEPRRITTQVYNGQPDPFNANAVASCAPADAKLPDGKPIVVLCKRVEQATTDEAGGQGFNAVLQSGVPARATRWTYNATGQVLTETDSRGKVITTNAYYTDTTTDHTIGDLKSTINAAGHVTTFPRYNAYGQPLEMVDANGTSTSYAYDLRQRLTSTTTAGKVTSYEYWPTGLLKKSTQPDGSAVSYEYDDAHRLIAVSDTLGNRIAYALDASGNRTKEDAKDPQGTLKRSMNRAFDALGRAQQATGRE
ncbi:RHS repeat domain-containing protein [Roseateles sp. MS654]|uniref:RHS repeat domain-containing protein n=1 Tax=Roseateles sp. MS654 TaxID=3412685 RepID=UPI003C2EF34B